MAEKQFPKGIFAKRRDNAPVYVVTTLNIKVPEFIPYLEKNQNNAGYVNIDILTNKDNQGQHCELNTWQPTPKTESVIEPKVEDHTAIDPMTGLDLNSEDIPF